MLMNDASIRNNHFHFDSSSVPLSAKNTPILFHFTVASGCSNVSNDIWKLLKSIIPSSRRRRGAAEADSELLRVEIRCFKASGVAESARHY